MTPPPEPFSLEAQQYIHTAIHLKFDNNPRIDYRPISQSKLIPSTINNIHSRMSIPLEMKWNVVGQATRFGYEKLSTKNKQILINSILIYECYHQGYSRKMGSIPSFIRWYTLLVNKLICMLTKEKIAQYLIQECCNNPFQVCYINYSVTLVIHLGMMLTYLNTYL